jgi:hypothetical protein
VALNQRLDVIQASVQSSEVSQSQLLIEIKDAFMGFHNAVQAHISSSGTLTELSHATGSYIPTVERSRPAAERLRSTSHSTQ